MFRTLASIIATVSDGLDKACRWMICMCGFAMALVTAMQVFFRYGLNNSLFWSEELGRVLLVQLTFFGSAVALKAHAHIGLDFLVRNFSVTGRKVIALVVQILSAAFFVVMMWYGAQFAVLLSHQSTATLGISRMIPFLAVPASGTIMLIHSIARFFEIMEFSSEDTVTDGENSCCRDKEES